MDDHDTRIQAAVAGDVSAMTELLHQYGPEVERTLSIGREWRSVLEPADVMQVTYLEAFLEITRYDLERSWITSAVVHSTPTSTASEVRLGARSVCSP